MASRPRAKKVSAQIEALAMALGAESAAVNVVVFQGETPQEAMAKHVALRPSHKGRQVWFEHRPTRERTDFESLLAVHSHAEINTWVQQVWDYNDTRPRHCVGIDDEADSDMPLLPAQIEWKVESRNG
jgi:hypothetical protein